MDNQQSDAVWFLLKTLSPALGKMVPTWAAYKSLMGQKKALTNVAMLPIINGSPTERENLYVSIKEAEKLRRKIFNDGKTIISFDLQLYINTIWLQERNDIKDSFVFQMGELQVVLCVLWNLVNAITEVSEYNSSKTDVIKDSHRSLLEAIETTNFAQLHKEFDSQLSNQSRFFRNFMKCFELPLLFVSASGDQLWELHFQSLHALLCVYIFLH